MNKKAVKKGIYPYIFMALFMLGILYILNLGSDISEEYTSLYKTLAIPTNILEIKENWKNKIETIKETYSLAIKALNILDNNKNLWHVENNKLYFHDEKLLKEYNSIISLLKLKNK